MILVGDDPASTIYTTRKGRQAEACGMMHRTLKFPASVEPKVVRDAIQQLCDDPTIDGILVQRPLPKSFIESEVVHWISPAKDVDAFHPENVGALQLGLPCFAPCTPAGVMSLLKHYSIDVAGKLACVIGRSSIVGKPMSALLLAADATVIQCHSRTQNLAALTRQADLVIVAAGKPQLIGAEHIKPGAVVVDVGIHRDPTSGKVFGDVRFDEVAPITSAITPVPGGVGPMTIHQLLENTCQAAVRFSKS